MVYPGIDLKKFRGFAIQNWSEEAVALLVVNESAFPKEFILEENGVYYAKVADVVRIMPLKWAKESGLICKKTVG